MAAPALLAPIPLAHLQAALRMLTEKDFVLFGSGSHDVFRVTDEGSEVFIYVSHDTAEPVVRYSGIYRGLVDTELEMRRLVKQGYRPLTTTGEKWPFYWKLSCIGRLDEPIPLRQIQLESGAWLTGYPRGPLRSAG
jgi:hypothetical protein